MQPYKDTVDLLFSMMRRETKYSLDTSQKLCKALQNPQNQYPTVHVAGTNGKGSVVTKIAATLENAGYKVGKYTSPHLFCVRERIQINSEMISEKSLTTHANTLLEIAKELEITPSFFEVMTALAFLYFAEQKVDIAIIETGLGGRLDATNIITPQLSIITSISLDHTEVLGNTISAIAKEKRGIVKPGIPALIGPTIPLEVLDKHEPLHMTLRSEPTILAKEALKILKKQFPHSLENLTKGLATSPPCRMEKHRDGRVIIDVAHNPSSLKNLFSTLLKESPSEKIRIVLALNKKKEIQNCLKEILPHISHMHLTTPSNDSHCLTPEMWITETEHLPQSIYSISNIAYSEIQKALRLSEEKGERLVICGSFYLMNDAYKALNIIRIKDPVDMNTKIP